MKKIFTLVLGLALMTACSSDDSGSSTVDSSKLTKKWYYSDTKFAGQTIPYDDHEDCGKDYIEFIAGGVAKDVDVFDCELITDAGTWTLSGNKLTISGQDETRVLTVSKLTDTALELTLKDSLVQGGPEVTVVQTFTLN